MRKELNALQRLFDHNYGNDFYIKAEEDAEIIEKALKEYAQYKAVEKELGIGLLTLLKVLKAKYIFVKNYKSYGALYFTIEEGKVWFDIPYPVDIHGWVEFKDYGKTWALTKEELE